MRILFITSTRIGDAVLSSGLINHLRLSHPGARFTIACGPLVANLFRDVPGLERIIPVRKRRGGRHWLALWAKSVGHVWDLVVDLRSSALAWTVMARERRVLRKSTEHRVVAAARVLGVEPPPPPHIFAGPQARAKANTLLPNGPVLAIGPTANWIGKQWPAERFAELVDRLTRPGACFETAHVLVLGGRGERAMAAPLLRAVDAERLIDQVGALDLLTTYACLERCRFFIGNDSGLMHMAAAAGIPTLGLFGPSDEALYGPWGDKAASVRGPRSFEDITKPPFDFAGPVSHMIDLDVDRVEGAVYDLWRRCTGQEPHAAPAFS